MNKKGLIPSGMSEEITISFKPTEYKYFYDSLRINTETENILLPIHAYPVLDRENLRNVFPRLIDFGTILVGTTNTIVKTEFLIASSLIQSTTIVLSMKKLSCFLIYSDTATGL